LREERRLKVSENRVLRRVSGPRRDEVIEEWRKLHNEELNDLYSLSNIVCLFSWRYNPLWLYFHSPVAGFSILVFEVS
jgi:hypothetical protein